MDSDRLALLFPGQASQYVGMGVSLAARSTRAAAILRLAEDITDQPLGRLCAEGPLEALTRTVVAQPAVVATSIMAWVALEECLPAALLERLVACCAGHSVGEYAALVAAGALTAEEALKLVRRRAEAMEMACALVDGGMAAVFGLEASRLAEICVEASRLAGQGVEIANLNAPDQVVISGERSAVELACRLAREAGARRSVALNVAGPFHSRYMEPASTAFAPFVQQASLHPPRFPVVLNQTAAATRDVAEIRRELIEQIHSPVRWTETLLAIAGRGVTGFVELGPGKVLSGLARRAVEHAQVWNIQDEVSLTETAGALQEFASGEKGGA